MGEESEYYTVDEALDVVGFGKFQVYVMAYAGLGYMAASMETMLVSFIGQSVKSEWILSSTQESLITSVFFGGILVGAYLSGFISDYYGRRKGLLSVGIVTSACAFLTAFAPNYISLVILRFMVAIGVGGACVYLSWFLEFVPAQNRGSWMVTFATFSTLGCLVESSLAWMIMPRLGWRWLLALSSIPAVATLAFFNPIPESPRYLCSIDQIVKAQKILKRAADINQTELPFGTLVSDKISDSIDEEEEATSIADPLLLSPKLNTSSGSQTALKMLFSTSLRRTTLLLWIVYFGINFSYYGVILLTSELTMSQDHCSSSSVIHLHSSIGDSQDSSYRDILVASFAELPGLVLSALMIDRIGRKISMQIMFMIGFIFILPIVFLQNEITTIISLFGARMFISGTLCVATVYAPEIYPTSVRATGVGLASAVGGIGGMICPLVAVGMLNECYTKSAIFLIELVIVVSGLCVFLFPLETKGQKLSDFVM